MEAHRARSIALVVASFLASTATAQSIYVDLGGGSPPSAAYGAAVGVPGFWNLTPNAQDPPPPFAPLFDIHHQPTGASGRSSFCDQDVAAFPATTGDDEALLDDWFYTDCYWNAPEHPTLEVIGLLAGTYELFVYPRADGIGPDNVFVTLSNGTTEGADPMVLPALGSLPGSFVDWGIGTALLHVTADGASLRMSTLYETGGLAGFQLLRLDDATPFCSGNLGGCPCGVGQPGAGCPSSFNASGASLAGAGSRQVSNDSLQLTATGVLPSGFCILYQGTTAPGNGLGVLYGDGLRCAGGSLKRIVSRAAVGGVLQYPAPGDSSVSVRGAVPVGGGFRTYQLRYRNPANYCTSDTFNTTNGVAVEWLP